MALIIPQVPAYRAMAVRSASGMRSARLAPSLVHVQPRPAPRWPAPRSTAPPGHFRGRSSAASAAERDVASQADLEDALENAAAEAQAAEAAAAAAAEAAAAARARAEELTASVAAAAAAEQELLVSVQDRRKFQMEETKTFLQAELERIFDRGEITRSRYSPTIRFEDPITSYNNIDGYVFNINLLRTVFKIDFKLHSIEVTGEDEVTACWTMGMLMPLLPWRPNLMFTGRTFYKVDPDDGTILEHIDEWDALQHNQFLSLEGALYVLRQFFQLQLTPNIESPSYTVLQKFKDYEIRYYPTFLVAETSQPMGAGPASGSGFTELAGYIFGGNKEQVKMEMTTPVFSSVSPQGNQATTMAFVMEGRFKDPAQLPTPLDPRVQKKQQGGGYFAAITFAGWPLDYEVVQNERLLRDILLREGLNPKPGYQLARYNEPTVLPALRRNEVLIELEGFTWP